jgi:hypothetical protein
VNVVVVPGEGYQPDESLYVELSDASNAKIVRAVGVVIIATTALGVPNPMAAEFLGATLSDTESPTSNLADTYTISSTPGGAQISGNPNLLAANDRATFWPAGEVPKADEGACATWSLQDPSTGSNVTIQEGLTVRAATKGGVTRAITLTKNVWEGKFYLFNVHVWNTSWSVPFKLLREFNLSSYLTHKGILTDLPWNVCVRVIGSNFQFELWTSGQQSPKWGDSHQGGNVKLPAGWDYPGEAGWYVGHLGSGQTATYTNLFVGLPQAEPSP